MHGRRVPADVGGVRVGEQGGGQHQHPRPQRVPRARRQGDEHEVPDAGQGAQWRVRLHGGQPVCQVDIWRGRARQRQHREVAGQSGQPGKSP